MAARINRSAQLRLAVAFAGFAVIAPILFVATPGLGDYVNHYVRYWLLAGGADIAPLNQMYEVKWNNTLSAVALDAVVAALTKLIPVTVVGPAVLGLVFLLGPLGASLLNAAVFRRPHWWQVLVFVLAFGFTTTNGLMNFHVGLGLALLATALDVRLSGLGAWPRLGMRMVFAGLLLTVHAFATAFYFALIGAIVLGRDFLDLRDWRSFAYRIAQAGVAVLPLLVLPLALAFGGSPLPGRHLDAATYGARAPIAETGIHWQDFDPVGRLGVILVPVRTYAHAPDILYLLLLVVPVVIAAWRGRLAVHGGLLAVGIALAIMSQFMPGSLLGTAWIEKRLPNMAALMMAASMQPMIAILGRRFATAVSLALFVVSVRAAWIGSVWAGLRDDTLSVERAISHIPAGAAVLPLQNHPDHNTRIWHSPPGRFAYGEAVFRHLPTLAVMQRHAFVPTVFSAAGKQPLAVRSPWSEIAVPDGDLPRPYVLNDASEIERRFPYVAFWRTRFDYLLLLNADMPDSATQLPADPALTLVADEGFARLYRIQRSGNAAAASPSR
jgi:hypothetical protein